MNRGGGIAAVVALMTVIGGGGGVTPALAQTQAQDMVSAQMLDHADQDAKDWLSYRGSYLDYDYSALSQINTKNVKNLEVAWIHTPGKTKWGLQSVPLAVDGILYYSSSYSRVFALDGATGEVLWSFTPELDDALIAKQTHSPMNRGIAISHGKVYVGTIDGRLIALDMKTGKKLWDTKLINSQKLTIGFSGAPLAVKDMVIIGGQGGEWPVIGSIFAVNAETGKTMWAFHPVADTAKVHATWGNDSWKTGGGGAWQPGTYDPATNTLWWGTSNPAPLFDWSGDKWRTEGARPGINLYTSSVVALDADTGKLKFFHQEIPHDEWDFDSAVGEFIMIDRDGKKLVVHPNKSGYVFVYNSGDASIVNVWRATENSNFVKNIDPKTGKLIGRISETSGDNKNICPSFTGAIDWPSGTYSPKTGLFYRAIAEACMNLKVAKTTPVIEPQAQLFVGAQFTVVGPNGQKPWGHVDARDPVSGKLKFSIKYPAGILATLISTAGNLLFVPDTAGWLHAYDARTGKELWKHNDGDGHAGGIISYEAKGKQYIAVEAGWGPLSGYGYQFTYGLPYTAMTIDAGQLVVYALK
jgi:PQQ-dependent dehydrogenase (methanol/ethanol family)